MTHSCGSVSVDNCPFAHANDAAAHNQKKVFKSVNIKSTELSNGGRSSTVKLVSENGKG